MHREWDPAAKTSRTRMLSSFGRVDQLDGAAIKRLITAVTRLLDTGAAGDAGAGGSDGMAGLESPSPIGSLRPEPARKPASVRKFGQCSQMVA